jgi:hypothetical protein
MKKKLLILLMITSMYVQAQEYKPVKIGIGLGYSVPGGAGSKGGPIFYIEPSYRANDKIVIGLRLEGAVATKGTFITAVSPGGITSVGDLSSSATASYTVNAQYYFSNENFRPFAGAGLGIYSSTSVSFNSFGSTTTINSSGSQFGFYPRIGFDVGHFTLQAEYNIVPSTTSEFSLTTNSGVSVSSSETNNSYLGIKAGFFFGGGRIVK